MRVNCKVSKIESVKNNIYKVYITPANVIDFKAGQYLFIDLNDKKQPFSIANCPTEKGSIELHIGSSDKSSSLDAMEFFVDALIKNKNIEIDAPHGEAWLRDDSSKPLLLIAGGTGLSYINSILKNCLNRGFTQPIYIYWGVKNSDFLYADSELATLSIQHSNLHYVPVVIEDSEERWLGKKGTVLSAVMGDFADLTLFDIYVCGPFMMAKAVKEQLILEKNARPDQMFADAFSYI
ncbi:MULTISPECIES: NAD(P)H-flavin reductase [Aliivibrio]|uniref:NAD(P)H-flavin reductase n=2 Tax=Aliivibrio logei TaxID=688 RepID=A0A1B9P3Y2_ALILO|nr:MULTISPECIES: NAD(P)H-flavin reductase [Aliivibrio]MBB1315671.1 NAD(P)H-flavin reductase [Aliivibrio sp. SR45-2]OCH23194.1 NAD(P)H-flavin reductase [Aliivibrio logei]OEF11936.1 NAD(P)H-flavin reductase [Aliivibrio logei 5S-186]